LALGEARQEPASPAEIGNHQAVDECSVDSAIIEIDCVAVHGSIVKDPSARVD